jgi:predicted nucleic acid-binding protein
MVIWDTTLVSRIYPGGPLESTLIEHRRDDNPIAAATPTIMEVVRGIQAGGLRPSEREASLRWLADMLRSGLLETVSLDRHAATVAGRIRARRPAPPSGRRRNAPKPEQRAGWVLDVQIAACAWTHGRTVVTSNASDFDELANLIATLYPNAPRLAVLRPEAA